MNKYLVEGMDKFLAKYKEEKKEIKKPAKSLKESLTESEIKEDIATEDYLPSLKDIIKFFVAGTRREKINGAKKVLDAMREEINDIGEPDEPNFYKEDENIKEFIFDMQDNTGEFGYLLGDDEDYGDYDTEYHIIDPSEYLKEETNMDKINKYLVSIGEAPITESIEEDTEVMGNFDKVMAAVDGKPVSASNKDSNYDKVKKVIDDKKSTPSNFDKIKKAIDDKKSAPSNYDKIAKTLGESKKSVKRSTNLMESLNSGFSKLYGDFDDTKSLNEACGKKTRKPLKEYKDMGQDLGEYQKWVDYDMKKYHKISDNTMSKIKKAGLSVVKDQYGQYEVIAKEADKDSDKDSKK